jgi:NDP-sugar pyrophosphorylase family protein
MRNEMGNFALEKIINRSGLTHQNEALFSDPFSFLREGFKAWIDSLLDQLGVGDGPVTVGDVSPLAHIEGRVFVSKGAKVGPFAYIKGPTFIGPGAEVRHGAFLRGQCYIDEKAVVGHSTEVKNAIFCKGAKAAHFAYVGDSILGQEINLGAGTKLANVKVRPGLIKITHPETKQRVSTGLKKFGAIIGDFAQTGCNSVLSPGTLLMPHTAVYPCVHFHGTLIEGVAKGN